MRLVNVLFALLLLPSICLAGGKMHWRGTLEELKAIAGNASGDMCDVRSDSYLYHYRYDSSHQGNESSPGVIKANDSPTGSWLLMKVYINATDIVGLGAAIDTQLTEPGPIGGTTPNSGTFTTVTANAVAVPVAPGDTGELQLVEDPVNGSHMTGFKAPASLAADLIYLLPATDGSAGQCLKTDGSLSLSWGPCSVP